MIWSSRWAVLHKIIKVNWQAVALSGQPLSRTSSLLLPGSAGRSTIQLCTWPTWNGMYSLQSIRLMYVRVGNIFSILRRRKVAWYTQGLRSRTTWYMADRMQTQKLSSKEWTFSATSIAVWPARRDGQQGLLTTWWLLRPNDLGRPDGYD